ncbi:ethylbenzene dehydrogenase-related protein [Thioalkalivibrio sp. ALgr3]|uniref:ethylbenzene dehydrogenase-related protein n=1 Tax=Thioalkalivibrio sp. ALgr3 TaxID=1239292 RepID=UPI000367A7E5|nr:ethylbenzene dehydrogenase-related protein [Thioalkalivibrio sp. ALgr3]
MKRTLIAAAVSLTPMVATGEPVKVDLDRNVYIPGEDLDHATLNVAATYDDEKVRIHYEYATDDPSWYHQYWVYQGDGEWERYGSGAGPDEHGLYEDRISMLLDDGGVDGFDRYGGWMTAHDGMRALTSEVDGDKVEAHPKLGEEMGRSDVRKYLPQTRTTEDPTEKSWDAIRDDDELAALQEEGVFLDLWQWRAHRSHPMGVADNGYVLHYRLGSEGRGMYTTNWDDDAGQPAYMLDPETTGKRALDWDRLVNREYDQDDPYFISEDNAVAFDPDHDWQEGDVIPQRFLRQPSGSRGAIAAEGGYEDGAWQVRLTRTLEAPNAQDSKSLEEGGIYNVAFAVHTGQVGARWHQVSLPQTLGLGVDDADIVATRVDDVTAANDDLAWTELPVMYPGQATWQWLHSDHPGAEEVRSGEVSIHDEHVADELRGFIIAEELRMLEADGARD